MADGHQPQACLNTLCLVRSSLLFICLFIYVHIFYPFHYFIPLFSNITLYNYKTTTLNSQITTTLRWINLKCFFLCLLFCSPVSRSCAHTYKAGERKSGVYTINPDGSGIVDVFCDHTKAGVGGVVVSVPEETGRFGEFLPRLGRRGFGNLSGEFWLGLDKIHNLTNSGNYFRVDLEDFDGKSYYAQQDLFKVAGEGQKYKLSLGSYSGLFSHHFSLQISDICHIGKRAVKCKQ